MTNCDIRDVCILRLSAIGDICHALPVVRSLQRRWPEARCTWIIGKSEAKLLNHIEDIEFIIFGKRAGPRSYFELRRCLRGRRFDALLHMQLALRASLVSLACRARSRIGYDRGHSKELQRWFVNRTIADSSDTHVMDVLFGFAEALGAAREPPRWDIPIPAAARRYAERLIDGARPALVLSPCSSHPLRNWRPEHYASVADHAARAYGFRILLCGGPGRLERQTGDAIAAAMREPVVDLIGKDTLIELLAVLERASLLLSPDSGPVHMATAVGTPVIGLYAATSSARSGPYFSRQWCVDRYSEAARRFLRRSAEELPWGTKIEREGVMDLIQPPDVIERLDAFMQRGRG